MVDLDKGRLVGVLRKADFEAQLEDDLLTVAVELEDGSGVELSYLITPGSEYSFPDFFIDLSKYPRFRGLAHVDPLGKICSFDPVTNCPNPKRPEDAIVETLKSVVGKLNDTIMGRNEDDYQDEISAYWSIECSGSRAYLFDALPVKSGTMYFSRARDRSQSMCIASSAERASDFAARLGSTEAARCNAVPCIALELIVPLTYPFPSTIREWDREISRSGKGIANAYRNFVVRCKRKSAIVVVTAPVKDGRAVFCLSQKSVDEVNGFRRGLKLYRYAVSRTPYGDERVEKKRLEIAAQGRLFQRGGAGAVVDGVQAIIGCGSLGSHLARALSDSGGEQFVLIDDDVLEVGNVARHVCGFESVGENKAYAVKRTLESANPNVVCEALDEDANVLIEGQHDVLKGASAVFVTAADLPLEYHMVEAFVNGAVSGPLVIIWLEPFMLAAHAIVLNKPQRIFDGGLFDAEFRFKRRVVANGDELYEREVGCQTTYMPYAGLDVQAFLIDFLRCWRQHPLLCPGGNYHFAWIGRVSDASSVGATVSPEFAVSPDYSHIVERVN